MFIAIDGLDGCGKSTASVAVSDILTQRGRRVTVREHPGDGMCGTLCRRLLLRGGKVSLTVSAILLFSEMFRTALAVRFSDTDVISVRYRASACFLGPATSKIVLLAFRTFMPKPDLDIVIDVSPSVALSRVSSRGSEVERFENPASMDRVRTAMLSLPGITVIDGNGSPESVVSAILDAIDSASH